MNYYDQDYTTTKLIQLEVDAHDNMQYPKPMTQDEVAKYCENLMYPANAYVDGEWVGSTEI